MGSSNSTPAPAAKPATKILPVPLPPIVAASQSESLLRQQIETLADVSPSLSPKSLTDVMQTAAQLAGCPLSIDADGLRAKLSSAAADDASSTVSAHPQLPVQVSVALWEKLTQSGVCHCATESHATSADPNELSTKPAAEQSDLKTTHTPRNVSLATTSLVEHIQKNLFESEQNSMKAGGDEMVVDLVLRKMRRSFVESFEKGIKPTSHQPEMVPDAAADLPKPPSVDTPEIVVIDEAESNQPEVIPDDGADGPTTSSAETTELVKSDPADAIHADVVVDQTECVEIPLSSWEAAGKEKAGGVLSDSESIELTSLWSPKAADPVNNSARLSSSETAQKPIQSAASSSSLLGIIKYLLGYSDTSVDATSTSTPHPTDDSQKQIAVYHAKSDDDDIAARSQLPDVIVAYWPEPTDAEQQKMAAIETPNATDDDDLDARCQLPAVIVAYWPVVVVVDDDDAPAVATGASQTDLHNVSAHQSQQTPRNQWRPFPAPRSSARYPNAMQQQQPAIVVVDDDDAATGAAQPERHNVSAHEVHISTPYVRTPRLGDAQQTPRHQFRPTPAPRSSVRNANAMRQHSAAMASVLQSIKRRKTSANDEVHTSTPFVADDRRTPRNTFLPSKTTGPAFNPAARNNSNKRASLANKDTGAKSTQQLQPRNLLATSSPFNTPRGKMHSTLSPQKPKPTDGLVTPKQQPNHRQLVAVGCHKQNWTPRLGMAISPFATPTAQCRKCQRSVTPLSAKGKAAPAQSRPWRPSPR